MLKVTVNLSRQAKQREYRYLKMDRTALMEKTITNHLVETKLYELFSSSRIKGTIHLSLGQEALDVGVISACGDRVEYGNHRSHGQYLAATGDVGGLFREIIRGIGGSQHLYYPGKFMSNGVLGNIVPLSVGHALALKKRNIKRRVICFIGDGAFGEGVIYESMQQAAWFALPITFVVVDNRYGMSATQGFSNAPRDVAALFRLPRLGVTSTESIDVFKVFEKAATHFEQIGDEPSMIHADVKRLCGHSANDTQMYRPREEKNQEYRDAYCPVKFLEKSALPDFSEVYRKVEQEIEKAANEYL